MQPVGTSEKLAHLSDEKYRIINDYKTRERRERVWVIVECCAE
jgi:hypothetical protein